MKPDVELSLVERSAHFVQIERALCDGGPRRHHPRAGTSSHDATDAQSEHRTVRSEQYPFHQQPTPRYIPASSFCSSATLRSRLTFVLIRTA
jgi:hypothetical protein